ncbi:hypothetical protein CASFOL_008955 [Castilleja foliolosa]|uniref:Mitochondrial transcription termination factor family protein n=1 Tax=Castilleja foliolosa TaxID=1961234 RepID=A0ABD3E1W7_9LAMI
MFAVFCRRQLGLGVSPNDCYVFVARQFRVPQTQSFFAKSCSTSVCENVSEKKSFTVSYLINSCGLSPNDAVSASKKLCIESPEKSDEVLKLLREYGFTDAHHIPKFVKKWPKVLLARCPTLLPKLEFFRSIGVPLPLLACKLSGYPFILWRSLENSIIPSYNDLKKLIGSDDKIVRLFKRAPTIFGSSLGEAFVSAKITMLREKGVPESTFVSLVMHQPALLTSSKEKLFTYIDRAIEMGFDVSKGSFVDAIQVFVALGESNLKQKMEVYRRCGWSDSETNAAFLKNPYCMTCSEENIMATMGFLVTELGCEASVIAQCPVLVCLSLEKRIKPRCLVAAILNEKGLKKMTSVSSLLMLGEEKFLKSYIEKYEKDVPELLDIYLGKGGNEIQWRK